MEENHRSSSEPFSHVLLPRDLQRVPYRVLEDYVHERLKQFLQAVDTRHTHKGNEWVEQTFTETYDYLRQYSEKHMQQRPLVLRFAHTCQGQGCRDNTCRLCKTNPKKRCTDDFNTKYLVNDVVTAKCGAPIYVEILDELTGEVLQEAPGGLHFEMCLLKGPEATAREDEAAADPTEEENYEDNMVLQNNKGNALLVCGDSGRLTDSHKVIINVPSNKVTLPDLRVSDSSNAMFRRTPNFRLLVQPVFSGDNVTFSCKPLVSPQFVVATRRVRIGVKEDFPKVDDPVSKVEQIGRETVAKLKDLKAAGRKQGVDLHLPWTFLSYLGQDGEARIENVGQLKELMACADQDATLRQQLMTLMKLSSESWKKAYEHTRKAIAVDDRPRIWFPSQGTHGLMFACKRGQIEFENVTGLLFRGTMEMEHVSKWDADQHRLASKLRTEAEAAWHMDTHPGWEVDYKAPTKAGYNPSADAVLGDQQRAASSAPAPPPGGSSAAAAAAVAAAVAIAGNGTGPSGGTVNAGGGLSARATVNGARPSSDEACSSVSRGSRSPSFKRSRSPCANGGSVAKGVREELVQHLGGLMRQRAAGVDDGKLNPPVHPNKILQQLQGAGDLASTLNNIMARPFGPGGNAAPSNTDAALRTQTFAPQLPTDVFALAVMMQQQQQQQQQQQLPALKRLRADPPLPSNPNPPAPANPLPLLGSNTSLHSEFEFSRVQGTSVVSNFHLQRQPSTEYESPFDKVPQPTNLPLGAAPVFSQTNAAPPHPTTLPSVELPSASMSMLLGAGTFPSLNPSLSEFLKTLPSVNSGGTFPESLPQLLNAISFDMFNQADKSPQQPQ